MYLNESVLYKYKGKTDSCSTRLQ